MAGNITSNPTGIDPTHAIVTPRLTLTPLANLLTGPEDAPTLPDHILNPLHELGKAGDVFKWMPSGPFATPADLNRYLTKGFPAACPKATSYIATTTQDGLVIGSVSFLNTRDRKPYEGVIEIGFIFVDPAQQGKGYGPEMSTGLVMYAMERGYQRVEWKTHHLNKPSQKCALKIGFEYEGTFRRHMHFKGETRNTVWYSIIADEYFGAGGKKEAMERYFASINAQ